MINTWNESLLHEELKDYYCGDKGKKEVPLEGSICDVVHDDGSIIEIQTANLGKLRQKLEKLMERHRVILVYPIARNTLIETYSDSGELKSRRKSPKHATIYDLFGELTGLWSLLGHENLEIHVVHADILELRVADGTGSWRRKGIRRDDRKLIKTHETTTLQTLESLAALLPTALGETFTVADLSRAGAGRNAGRMAWVLRKVGVVELSGKKGHAYLYRRKSLTSAPVA